MCIFVKQFWINPFVNVLLFRLNRNQTVQNEQVEQALGSNIEVLNLVVIGVIVFFFNCGYNPAQTYRY